MKLAMIVAASENDVIGVNGDLPWRLSADLRRFKKLTMGHHIIMGRKTYDSIGTMLPGRTTVVVTRNHDFQIPGVDPLLDGETGTGYKVASSVESALEKCADDSCPFVVGGAQIYQLAMQYVSEIQLTRVHVQIDGDTFLPSIDWNQWQLISEQRHPRDDKNESEYSFQVYTRALNQ